nr:hypothetical protein [Tanacetum cinerariifolium]
MMDQALNQWCCMSVDTQPSGGEEGSCSRKSSNKPVLTLGEAVVRKKPKVRQRRRREVAENVVIFRSLNRLRALVAEDRRSELKLFPNNHSS